MNETQKKCSSLVKECNEVAKRMGELRGEMTTEIHSMLTEMGSNITTNEDEDAVYISYDGGSHCEYDSCLCAAIKGVTATMSNGLKSFSVSIDECDDYNESRLTWDDLLSVFDLVRYTYDEFIEERTQVYDTITEMVCRHGDHAFTFDAIVQFKDTKECAERTICLCTEQEHETLVCDKEFDDGVFFYFTDKGRLLDCDGEDFIIKEIIADTDRMVLV